MSEIKDSKVWEFEGRLVTRYCSPAGDVACHLGLVLADYESAAPVSLIAWSGRPENRAMPDLDEPRLIESVDGARASALLQFGMNKFVHEIAYASGDAPLYAVFAECALRIMRAVAINTKIAATDSWPPRGTPDGLAKIFGSALRNGSSGAGAN